MAKTSSKSKSTYYASYKANRKWESNRRKKLQRTLKNQPNNLQVVAALENIKYRRKTPTTRTWSSTWIRTAKLFKQAIGRFDPAIMSSNQDAAKAALNKNPLITKAVGVSDKEFFSIGARLLAKG